MHIYINTERTRSINSKYNYYLERQDHGIVTKLIVFATSLTITEG
jgi:hypothetical protein